MLSRVWKWAGAFRQSERNLGIDAYRIPIELRQLLDDCRYWIENKTYESGEIAARFHHRLVSIHPFPNGNGRHSRLAADLLLVVLGSKRFTWGRVSLVNAGETRRTYIEALRAADNHDINPLLAFVRS
jgi:Fic-DOC domain mobile mystery protein B